MKDGGEREKNNKKKALIRFRRVRITVNVSGHWVECVIFMCVFVCVAFNLVAFNTNDSLEKSSNHVNSLVDFKSYMEQETLLFLWLVKKT